MMIFLSWFLMSYLTLQATLCEQDERHRSKPASTRGKTDGGFRLTPGQQHKTQSALADRVLKKQFSFLAV
jgi:hypothetical protein